MINKTIAKVFDLCFPSKIYCIACDNLIDNTRMYSICDRCIKEIKWNVGFTCAKCGKALASDFESDLCYDCQNANHVFGKGYSCATYDGWTKRIVQNMKYKDKSFISDNIAEIMIDREVDLSEALLIPVPMNIIKKRKRGFDQAELIATYFSEKAKSQCEKNVLKRRHESVAMSSLGRQERKLNLINDFYVTEYGKEIIKERKIVLIDDVYTTGSTANACAETLLNNGARSVDLFVFASGDNRRV